jgi:hypothetical protein
MSIFAFGASYEGDDMTQAFVSAGVACVGWDQNEAPYAHQMLRRITVGDVVAIKSYAPRQGLFIKAVGLVTEPHYLVGFLPSLGHAVRVDWVRHSDPGLPHHVGVMGDKADYIRRGTLFEELNPSLQKLFIDLLRSRTPEPLGSNVIEAEAE